MVKHLAKLRWTAWIICILCGVILSIKNIKEPDLWWQLTTGEWILKNGRVPFEDIFSYTYAGTDWINVKWGYEVLIASIARLSGVESILLLQAVITVIFLLFLFRASNIFKSLVLKRKDFVPTLGVIVTSLLTLFMISFRMNGRPEIVSFCLSVVFLFILFQYRKEPDYKIFLLIPLQILWTNMHEAYGMGAVMVLIFTIPCYIEYWLFKIRKPKTKDLVKLTIVSLLVIVSMAVHPYGIRMILHPLNILSQLGENKFTSELYSFTQEKYWQPRAILNILIFISCLVFLLFKLKHHKLKELLNRIGLSYLVLFAAFFYLSLSAYRNIPFFIFISFPLLVLMIDSIQFRMKTLTYLNVTMIIVGVIFYLSVGTGSYYKQFQERDRYGLEINVNKNPVGAAMFIEENLITGKGFVDYLSSSYLLWHLWPNFKTYIDLRDLDIFPSKFIENVMTCYVRPDAKLANGLTLWEYVDQLDTFNYVVLLNSKSFMPLHRHLVNKDAKFELVYADPLSSIYLRRNEKNQELTEKYGFNNEKNVFRKFPIVKPSPAASFISNLFWPLYKPEDFKDYNYYGAARIFYDQIGKEDFKVDKLTFE